ncbi:MAG: hypothetical protein HY877_02645 [Deltaproteobacteria bacterium]|nr:hypothetical protein [Deltaproteobacteria bacterium]
MKMNIFLNQIRRSAKKKAILSATGLFYVGYLGVAFFCHCLDTTAHHGKCHQAHTKLASQHAQDPHHPSHNTSPTPHFCDCVKMESVILASSATPAPVKYAYVVSLTGRAFSTTTFLASPPHLFINSNYHGPPKSVPIYIQNQVFLI